MTDFGQFFKKNYIKSSSESFLYLTILPTEQCNFRCVYCYEDFSIGKMNEDTVTGIKALLTREAPKLKALQISWFGGEPTLNSKAITEISEHIQGLQRQYDFSYVGHMTTNGYLVNLEAFERYVSLGTRDYQITLDGDKQSHDQTRLQMNGKGSFDVIWQNLLSYRQSSLDFRVGLRLHLTAENTESMYTLCQMIKREFGDDQRFFINIQEIKDHGKGTEESKPELYVPGETENRMLHIKEFLAEFEGVKEVRDSKSNPYICYASMPRHLLIRADGRIGKCTVMLKDDRNDLGRLTVDGRYELDGDKMDIWVRGMVNLDEKELGCPATNLPRINKYNPDIAVVEVA